MLGRAIEFGETIFRWGLKEIICHRFEHQIICCILRTFKRLDHWVLRGQPFWCLVSFFMVKQEFYQGRHKLLWHFPKNGRALSAWDKIRQETRMPDECILRYTRATTEQWTACEFINYPCIVASLSVNVIKIKKMILLMVVKGLTRDNKGWRLHYLHLTQHPSSTCNAPIVCRSTIGLSRHMQDH